MPAAKAAPEDDALAQVAARYAVAITPAMEALIEAPHDPIAKQFRPDARELEIAPDELSDPIGDTPHTPVKGVVHRYPDRCLLKLVHVCPVYCRFCFRREMVGPQGDGTLTGEELHAALAYIESQPGIWEVILTGGDPFLLSAEAKVTQLSTLPPNVQVQIPPGQPMPLIPGLKREVQVDVFNQCWEHNKDPKGITR
jgi:lysine 2,3-aminomutase